MTPVDNSPSDAPMDRSDIAPEATQIQPEPVPSDDPRLHDNVPTYSEAVGDEPVGNQAMRTGIGDRSTHATAVVDEMNQPMASGAPVTGGDIDAMNEQAKVVGEEAIGGTTPTPDQSNVDDIADSVGVDFERDEPVRVTEKMRDRDRHRWELEPDSGDRPERT